MSALFLELARKVLFPLPAVRLATHKLIIPVDAVVGVKLLATTLAGKHMATVLPKFVLPRLENDMISLTHLSLTPAGSGASR